MRQLTNLELIRKAEDSVERLKLEKAVSLYDEGVRRFPNDTLIMDQYTDLLIQLGQFEKAKQLIERSIQLNPERDGQKYMNLAEMLSGADAVQMYIQGIKVLKTDYERFKASLNKTQENLCKKQMASAHASIAESYMTEPLCDEPDAE
jgi:tetratricopeptide (TPR) repeat protein